MNVKYKSHIVSTIVSIFGWILVLYALFSMAIGSTEIPTGRQIPAFISLILLSCLSGIYARGN